MENGEDGKPAELPDCKLIHVIEKLTQFDFTENSV